MNKYINDNLDNMINDLASLVNINTELSDDEKPFGSNNIKVLNTTLNLFEKYGLKTTNLDNYCGFGEVGSGDKTIGIVAHLDVVPAGDGWKTDPFKLTRIDDTLYGRGVSDDKGAVIASLYALKYLIDTNYEFKKKVRLIVGCNEETGSKCIKHYVEKEGNVDMGFTPDGNFPGIYAEKGRIGASVVGKTKIIEIYGGDVSNAVCKKVTCKVLKNDLDLDKFMKYLDQYDIKYEINVKDELTIIVYGKAAHASTPELGVNAFNYLMEALFEAGYNDIYVNNFHKYFGLDLYGEKVGFKELEDDISNTTVNFGVISKKGDTLESTIDIRYPVKTTKEKALDVIDSISSDDFKFVDRHASSPIFFDVNSPMIKALDKAYRDVTKDYDSKMEAIGGGTYAKSIKGIIAFGCEFQGENNHIHDVDERLSIDSFIKQVEIYIEAIKNLNEV